MYHYFIKVNKTQLIYQMKIREDDDDEEKKMIFFFFLFRWNNAQYANLHATARLMDKKRPALGQ